ncbi:MAG: VWA domain-containing protein, partial [Chloroflexi bacterium]|nr:VWA domain-containing protein [Chloroflexota bacterium]
LLVAVLGVGLLPVSVQPVEAQITQCGLDLVLSLDSSGSIDNTEFTEVRNFATGIVNGLPVQPGQARVSVAQFSNGAQIEIGLSDDPVAVINTINTFPKAGGGTNLAAAIQVPQDEIVLNGRPTAARAIIVLTDGVGNINPAAAANAAKAAGTFIFSVGVGSGVDVPTLNLMASDPDADFVYLAADFNALQNLVIAINNIACTLPPVVGTEGIGIYDSARALWLLRNSLTTGIEDINFVFGGLPGSLPVAGDWNGDGIDTPGIFVPSTGAWYLRDTNDSGVGDYAFVFGGGIPSTVVPVAGDWNGDGTDEVGLYAPDLRMWMLRNTLTSGNADITFEFGLPGYLPVVGDWDGDGVDTPALHNPATALWLQRNSNTSGIEDNLFVYGGLVDALPVAGDWNGNGIDTPGIHLPSLAPWYVRNSSTTGNSDLFFVYGGIFGALPVTGRWTGGTTPPPIVANGGQLAPADAPVVPLAQTSETVPQGETNAAGELPSFLAPTTNEVPLPVAPVAPLANPNAGVDGNLGGELSLP